MAEVSESAAAAKIAMAEISAAAAVIPAAWPIAQIVYFNQCDPQAMMTAAAKWLDMFDQLSMVKNDVDDARGQTTPAQWTGDDRASFEGYVDKYQTQLFMTQMVSITVGTTVMIVSGMLLILIIAYTVLSTILFAFAAFIVAAGATVVGAPAAASAMVTANTIAVEGGVLLRGLIKVIEGVSTAGAATIGLMLAGNVGARLGTGDVDALGDLLQATVDGTDNVVMGFLSKFERDFAGYGIHSTGRHVASPNGAGSLVYGAFTQSAPAGDDGEGNNVYGTGGIVDNAYSRGTDGEMDIWNH